MKNNNNLKIAGHIIAMDCVILIGDFSYVEDFLKLQNLEYPWNQVVKKIVIEDMLKKRGTDKVFTSEFIKSKSIYPQWLLREIHENGSDTQRNFIWVARRHTYKTTYSNFAKYGVIQGTCMKKGSYHVKNLVIYSTKYNTHICYLISQVFLMKGGRVKLTIVNMVVKTVNSFIVDKAGSNFIMYDVSKKFCWEGNDLYSGFKMFRILNGTRGLVKKIRRYVFHI